MIPMRPTILRGLRSVALVVLLGAAQLAAGAPLVRAAEFPQFSAALGGGIAGLFHEESLGGAPRSSEMGRFASAAYWLDLGYLSRSHLTGGFRVHYLRVAIDDGGRVGTLDILPATLFIGYRHGVRGDRLRGFATIGAGVASARFLPAAAVSGWEGPDGGEPAVSAAHPAVLAITAGTDVTLSEDLSLEVGLASIFMDTVLALRPTARDEDGTFVPERTYQVAGRHLLFTVGLRWWVELW